MAKRNPTFVVADLTYPNAHVVDESGYGGIHNVLYATSDDMEKVWAWYSRRLGTGDSPVGVGLREFEDGPLRLAMRRTPRKISRDAPFTDDAQPQVFTLQQGARAITVVLSRDESAGETAIMLLVFG